MTRVSRQELPSRKQMRTLDSERSKILLKTGNSGERAKRLLGRDAILHARCALRRNANLEHASPVLGSGLGKIGQAGDPGIGTPGRGPGALGGAGRGALILPSGVGRGARGADFVRGRGARGAGQRRPAPLPTLSLPASPPPARMAERPRRAAWQERAARSCALRRVRWSQRADLEHGHAQHCPLPKT